MGYRGWATDYPGHVVSSLTTRWVFTHTNLYCNDPRIWSPMVFPISEEMKLES